MSTQQHRSRRNPTEFYAAMLQLANKLNCQLRPTPEDATILRGLCPFHEATVMNKAKTLKVDTKSSRFQCHYCHASGNPIAFAAMVWGMNAHDASNFLRNIQGEAEIQRPKWGPDHYAQNAERKPHARTLNSGILTRASRFFEQNLYTSYPVLNFLARLGINPDIATQDVQVGYSTGHGLVEYLLTESDAEDNEIRDSGLVDPNTGVDIFAGRITLTDTDHTGGALWICGFNAEPPENRKWYRERPSVIGVVGRKPFMFGQHAVTRENPHPVITDDARLYIALKANGHAVILLPQKGASDEGNLERAKRIAETLVSRRVKKAALAMHNRDLSRSLRNALMEADQATEVLMHDREAILNNLRPEARDLGKLLTESSIAPERTRRQPTGPDEQEHPADEAQPEAKPETDVTPTPVTSVNGHENKDQSEQAGEEAAIAGTCNPEGQDEHQPSYQQEGAEELSQ